MGLKLQRTERVGDMLHSVLNGVGKVVHGVDAPLVAGAVMELVVDAVEGGVTHIEVAAGQVDLGPSVMAPLGNSPARIRRKRSRDSSLGRSR